MRQAVEDGDYSVHVACEATTRNICEIRFEGSHAASEKEKYESERPAVVKKATVAAPCLAKRGSQTTQGDSVVSSVCDASHADEHCERTGEPCRGQGGRMTGLATRGLVDQTKYVLHVTACA